MHGRTVPGFTKRPDQIFVLTYRFCSYAKALTLREQADLFKKSGGTKVLSSQDAGNLSLTCPQAGSDLRLGHPQMPES